MRPEDNARTVTEAIELFIKDKMVQGVTASVVARYESELGRFQGYCEKESVFTVSRITRDLLTGYAATWEERYTSSNTRASVRERLRGFLCYCYEAEWMERIPPVPRIRVDEVPTLPLTPDEYARLLKTVDTVRPLRWDSARTRPMGEKTRHRVRALIHMERQCRLG